MCKMEDSAFLTVMDAFIDILSSFYAEIKHDDNFRGIEKDTVLALKTICIFLRKYVYFFQKFLYNEYK